MILNETMNEIADAIREKTGKSELIAPVDFASEIKGITAGGGSGESGGSNMAYLDVSGVAAHGVFVMIANIVKYNTDILPAGMFFSDYASSMGEVKYIGIDFSEELLLEGAVMTKEDFLNFSSVNIDSIPRLTKEQFYDLNA